MPATARLIAAMPATPEGQRTEQLVEGGQHGILGDDRDVLLAAMALLEDFHHLLLGLGDGFATPGLDQDAEQRVGVEHGLSQRHRHDDQFVGIHAQPLADRLQDANHAQAAVADADQLADGRFVAEHFLADLVADDGDRGTPIPVLVRQAAALCELEIADRDEVAGRAGDHDFAQAAAEADFRGAGGERRNPADRRGAAQRGGIVDGQVARCRGDGIGRIETAGAGAAGQHDDEIGADRRELPDDIAPRPVAERRQDDDGGDADRHGEHRQRGAHRVAGRRIAGEAQRVSQPHGHYRGRYDRLP